jgi:hypothetical protein
MQSDVGKINRKTSGEGANVMILRIFSAKNIGENFVHARCIS